MTNEQILKIPFAVRAEAVLALAWHGIHHCPDIEKEENRWTMDVHEHLSTWDFDWLTRLVIGAHDYCVRVTIAPRSNRTLRIMLHPRNSRTDGMSQRHPTLEEAIANIRKSPHHLEP